MTKKEKVVENYHGTYVADPYRWLEDADSRETKDWVKAQNQRTHAYLGSDPRRAAIESRLTDLMDYPKYSVPSKEGNYYYFLYNSGLENQAVFYRTKDLNSAEKEVVLDPNTMNDRGTAALTTLSFSQDGSKLAYGVSEDGSDWQEIKIRNLETGEDYPEILKWCKFTQAAWTKDERGFFYSRYPEPEADAYQTSNFHHKVYYHEVGQSQENDQLIFEKPEAKELSFSPQVSDDDRYLILTVLNGTEPKAGIYYRRLNSDDAFTVLIPEREDDYTFIGNEQDVFYFYTNQHAPKGRIIAIDLKESDGKRVQEIIPEGVDAVSHVDMIHQSIVLVTLHDAYERLTIYDLDGELVREVPLPAFISILDVSGKKEGAEMFLSYTSYLYPSRVERYDFESGDLSAVFDVTREADDAFETTQVFYTSKDGTRVPMFLTHKKGLELTGDHPVLLYGYGGYNISLAPAYSASKKMWLEAGGIYAEANLRGGGEYGEAWHLDGILDKKQNVFDDFIAAAQWLIANKYTNPSRLAIMGGSNGGLLVAACMTQRPDLFGAVLCLVPVTDMLRFHRFTVGRFWTNEFGNAEENKDHFEFMYKYSPLHQVRENADYPPTLITTADTDDRVVPLHAYKFAATLQEAYDGHAPLLLRVEENAGHGLGKPTSKVIAEQADIYTFIFKQFGMHVSSF